MTAPILPGATLGVLGGGQLGRMFALAARRMGYRVSVLTPEADSPTGQIAYQEFLAPYDDLDAVEEFARHVDVVTFEFENVPSATAEAAARHAPVRPAGALLHAAQNRAREKQRLSEVGLPVAPFATISTQDELRSAAAQVGFPAILKTASSGYDGHGQHRVADEQELASAWDQLDQEPCVLEGVVPFEEELSVVGARGVDGSIALYEPFLNRHRNHILDITLSPAPIPSATRTEALELARALFEGLDVVGTLCVELFLLGDGSLVVNEIAPRPHNSGHVTIDAHECCQFEQQVRSVCALPLGSTQQLAPAAAMANLLGDHWLDGPPDWAAALGHSGVHLHLYGKAEARADRKMGHLTVLDDTIEGAEGRAVRARQSLNGIQ